MIAALMSQMRQYETQMEQMRQEAEIHRNQVRSLMEKNHRITNENLKRIAMAPVQVVGQATATTAAAAAVQMVNNQLGDPKAVISPNPRSYLGRVD
jgi:regulator of replication initiation timing